MTFMLMLIGFGLYIAETRRLMHSEPKYVINMMSAQDPELRKNTANITSAAKIAAMPGIVTNVVRDLSLGGIWDSQLEVWWTPRMRNGSLTYEATTNVNLNAGN